MSKELDYALEVGFTQAFRYGSEKFFEVITEARAIAHKLDLSIEDMELVYSDLGTWAEYDGESVPLDLPIPLEDWDGNSFASIIDDSGIEFVYAEKKDPPLNKPMKGDVRKWKVYVKNPKTGNIKKVNFGTSATKAIVSDPARRKSFIARHKCTRFAGMGPEKRLQAQYWACTATPRLLGLSFRYW